MTTLVVRRQVDRLQTSVVNIRHEEVSIDDLDRVLLGSMDGRHDIEELVSVGLTAIEDGTLEIEIDDVAVVEVETLAEYIRNRLDRLVTAGLVLDDRDN